MPSEPTRGAEAVGADSWTERRFLARLIWTLAVLAPPLVSGVGVYLLRVLFWRSDGAWGAVAWVLQLAVTGIALALVTERVVRRVIPLTHLLRLTLHFPDNAPSRYGVALRTGTIRQQQAIIASVREHGFSEDDLEAFEQLVVLVMALGHHERLTRGHTERVRAYTDLIAAEMDLPAPDREKLHWAAMLHDVGKLGVPSELLSLPGRPTDEQWEIIKQHPAIGAEMVERFADWLGDWRFAAGDHHERWDGGGYPRGLSGVDISMAGRIVAIADAYDVITSARSYKKPIPAEAARAELVRCAGSQFDPAIVRAFLRISTGDLRAGAGRMAWTTSLPGILAGAGQAATVPLTAAAGILGFPLAAGALGLGGLDSPFSLLTPTEEVATAEVAEPDADDTSVGEQGHADADDADEPAGADDDPDTEPSQPGAADDADAERTPVPTPTPTLRPGSGDTGGTGGDGTGPLPTVGIPDVPTPTVDVPDLPLPTVDIPDVPLPTVDIPDLPLPTVDIPDLPLPTVDIPDVPLPTPTVHIPDVPLPTPTVPPLPTPTVHVPLPTPTVGVPELPGL